MQMILTVIQERGLRHPGMGRSRLLSGHAPTQRLIGGDCDKLSHAQLQSVNFKNTGFKRGVMFSCQRISYPAICFAAHYQWR